MIVVREETPGEILSIKAVILAAFGRRSEALLVDALRAHACDFVSLVVLDCGELVANAVLTPVTVDGASSVRGLGIGPVSVAPEHQGRGIGTALVRHAIRRSMRGDFAFAVVSGAPDYYARFGFKPAAAFGLSDELCAEAGDFQAIEFAHGALRGCPGLVRYVPEFSLVTED
jgi:putative acetyltransferase